MPRPRDPKRIRFGDGKYEVDPDWSYYGSLIFQPATGRHVGWVNARSQTGWQVFHTNGHPLGQVLLTGDVRDYRGARVGEVTKEPDDVQALVAVGHILDSTLAAFEP